MLAIFAASSAIVTLAPRGLAQRNAGSTPPSSQTAHVAGFAYTIRVSAGPPSAPTTTGADNGLGAQRYVGHAIVARSRGRVDIVEGGADSLFGKGDYLLFDSTDVVVVHPVRHEFIAVSGEGASKAMEGLQSMGVTLTLSDEKVVLDSLGPSDTIAGIPTRHYRMTVAFNMSMDAGVMQQRLGTESITDYWVASVPGLPPNPLLRSNGLSAPGMTGMFKSLSARVDSVSARMGPTITLRTRATSRLITGPGQEVRTEQRSDVSDLSRRDVDESLLMLPPGYKAAPIPGMAGISTPDAGAAKWRRPPRERER
jgi:hypothetical protein